MYKRQIQNVRYLREIQELFHSFVRVMSSAIDERSPYNGNHTRHMVACGDRFLDYLNHQAQSTGKRPPFSPERREEFLMSIWLHDIGKLVIPLEIMDKPTRLLPEQHKSFLHRMEVIRLLGKIDSLSGKKNNWEQIIKETESAEILVESINTTGYVTDENLSELELLAQKKYVDMDGEEDVYKRQSKNRKKELWLILFGQPKFLSFKKLINTRIYFYHHGYSKKQE